MFRLTELAFIVATWSLATAHTVIVYPGWRGNNINTNATISETDPSIPEGSLGITYDNETGLPGFPYGMQWMYPCTSPPPRPSPQPLLPSSHISHINTEC